ncbi:MAG TPA: CPBP family intramembrane glutamic endopeptidase [Actinomycetaceae bacterium]|nr:CPBP family intramembrane glutamic endopeptidase [Actinomycetaceae bacterium]
MTHVAETTPTHTFTPDLAVWRVRKPVIAAIVFALGGLLLTAIGSATGQVTTQVAGLDTASATLLTAAFVGVSALVGLAVMKRSPASLAAYGFRPVRNADKALWFLPLAVLPVMGVVVGGIQVTPVQALAYAALAIAIGFSEEIWYRGLVQAVLRPLGTRRAAVWGSVLFGVMHLANALSGTRPPLYLVLQVVFAALTGFVLAELVILTGSLWPGIVWHLAYDLVGFSSGGDPLSTVALAGSMVEAAIVTAYAVWLWRRLPAEL